jgi:hypothetical protein
MNLEERINIFKNETLKLYKFNKQLIKEFNKLAKNVSIDHIYSIAFLTNLNGMFIEKLEELDKPILALNFLSLLGAKLKEEENFRKTYFYHIKNEKDINKNLLNIVEKLTKYLIKENKIEFYTNYFHQLVLFRIFIHEFTHSIFHHISKDKSNLKKEEISFINEIIAYTLEKQPYLKKYYNKQNLKLIKREIFKEASNKSNKLLNIYLPAIASVYLIDSLKNIIDLNIIMENKTLNMEKYIKNFNFLYNVTKDIVKNLKRKNLYIEERPLKFLKEFIKESEKYIKNKKFNYNLYFLKPVEI